MALDALGASDFVRGQFGLAEQYDRERLQIARGIRDPFELVDTYYTAAWTALEIGRYAETVALGEEFEDANSTGTMVGILALRAAARVPHGQWDASLADQERLRDVLGDRAALPPSFASAGYGAKALIHTARGEDDAAQACLAEMWQWDRQDKRTQLWPLPAIALALARRGDFSGSRQLLDQLAPYAMSRPRRLEAMCTLVAEEGAWHESRSLVNESRHLAESGRLLALDLHADRLEGRALAASGDVERGVSSLERAAAGVAKLGAVWEVALTQLSLGEALTTLGRHQEAQHVLEPASREFGRLRVKRELGRAHSLMERVPGS